MTESFDNDDVTNDLKNLLKLDNQNSSISDSITEITSPHVVHGENDDEVVETIFNLTSEPAAGVTLFSESLLPFDPKNCDATSREARRREKKQKRAERRKEERKQLRKEAKEAKVNADSENVNYNALVFPSKLSNGNSDPDSKNESVDLQCKNSNNKSKDKNLIELPSVKLISHKQFGDLSDHSSGPENSGRISVDSLTNHSETSEKKKKKKDKISGPKKSDNISVDSPTKNSETSEKKKKGKKGGGLSESQQQFIKLITSANKEQNIPLDKKAQGQIQAQTGKKQEKMEKKAPNTNNNRPVKLGDIDLSPEFEKELEQNKIFLLKKKPIRFPKAKFFCRLCDYHLDAVVDCEKHIKDNRHIRRKEIAEVDAVLVKLPNPSERQVEAITAAVEKVCAEHGLPASARQEREAVVQRLEAVVREKLPDVMMFMYGSSLTCFGLTDADVNVNLNSSQKDAKLTLLLKDVYLALTDRDDTDFTEVKSEFSAKVPAVKLTDRTTGLKLTVTIHCYAAQCSSQLLAIYSDFDPRVRKLAQAFRYWARTCGLDRQSEGFIPPQAFNLMVIYFLQHTDPQLVPIIQPPKIKKKSAVSGEEVGDFTKDAPSFERMREKVMKVKNFSHPEMTIGKLWLRLLNFYTLKFDTAVDVVSIRSSEALSRSQKPWNSKKLAVEDPYMEKKNMTRMVNNSRIWEYWQDSIRKASYYFSLPRNQKGQSFLSNNDIEEICRFKKDPDAYRGRSSTNSKETESKKKNVKKTLRLLEKKVSQGKISEKVKAAKETTNVISENDSSKKVTEDISEGTMNVTNSLEGINETERDSSKNLTENLSKVPSDIENTERDYSKHLAENIISELLSDVTSSTCGINEIVSNFKSVQIDDKNVCGVPNSEVPVSPNTTSTSNVGSVIDSSLDDMNGGIDSSDSKTVTDHTEKCGGKIEAVGGESDSVIVSDSTSSLKDDNQFKALELLDSDKSRSSVSSCDSIPEGKCQPIDESDQSSASVVSDNSDEDDVSAFQERNLEPEELISEVARKECSYDFTEKNLTSGKGPNLVCTYCEKEGHLKNACPEDELPEVLPLPKMTQHHLDVLTQTLLKVPYEVGLSHESYRQRKVFLRGLEEYIRGVYRDAELQLFGSSCNGFGFDKSDMDICMTFASNRDGVKLDKTQIIESLFRQLRGHPELNQVQAIPTAKVPIVKFTVKCNQLEGDISLYNTLAQENTRLLHCYSQIDSRVQVLGYTIKTFAKVCDIGDASRGSLSSYAYILMMLYYLQQVQPPVLPVLQELYDTKERPTFYVENCDAWFMDDLSKLPKLWPEGGKNKLSVAELWLGFLRFYVEEFNVKEFVVCIRQKALLTRFEKLWNGTCVAIEDPFDQAHNLGSGLNRKMNNFIFKTFINGRMLYGSPVDDIVTLEIFKTYKCPSDYFFDTELLAENRPLNARGCRKCGKIGHLQRQCPQQLREWEEQKQRQHKKQQMDRQRPADRRQHQRQQHHDHHERNQPQYDHPQYRRDSDRRNNGVMSGSPKQISQYSLRDNPRIQAVTPGLIHGPMGNQNQMYQQYNRGQHQRFSPQQQMQPHWNQDARSSPHQSYRGQQQAQPLMNNSPRSGNSDFNQRMYYNTNISNSGHMGGNSAHVGNSNHMGSAGYSGNNPRNAHGPPAYRFSKKSGIYSLIQGKESQGL